MRTYLINARKSKKFTQEYVAEQSEITRQYYGMIENGERTPSVNIAKKIGSVLGIEWTIFFDHNSNLGLLIEDKQNVISSS